MNRALLFLSQFSLLLLYLYSYPLAINLIATGKIDVKPLITQRYKIDQALEGFKLLRQPGDLQVVKVLIQYD